MHRRKRVTAKDQMRRLLQSYVMTFWLKPDTNFNPLVTSPVSLKSSPTLTTIILIILVRIPQSPNGTTYGRRRYPIDHRRIWECGTILLFSPYIILKKAQLRASLNTSCTSRQIPGPNLYPLARGGINYCPIPCAALGVDDLNLKCICV